MQPHRGSTVLVLGILGIPVCFICGIIAWVMANKDLAAMDAGQMDPAGRDQTKAGKICGIIGTILGILGLIVWIIYIVFIGAMVAGGGLEAMEGFETLPAPQ